MRLIEWFEKIAEASDGFRRAQKQKPVRLEGIVERRNCLPLEARLEIDHQIAATDEVHARKRRIVDEILSRKNNHFRAGTY